jgi:hypothetical protein
MSGGVATIAALLAENDNEDDDDNETTTWCSAVPSKHGCHVWKYVYRQLRNDQTCVDATQPGGGGGFILGMLLPKGLFATNSGC